MIKKIALLLACSYTLLNAQMISRTKVNMGTFITITLQEKDKEYIEDGFRMFDKLNMALSSYHKEATISRLNAQRYVKLESYTYEALLLSQKYYRQTNHYFNIGVGSITKDLYHFGEDEQIPSQTALQNAIVDFNGLHFNQDYALLDEGLKIDLGGMGKGFSVDKLASYYQSKGINKGVIGASGDIRCLDTCKIEVEDPFSDAPLLSFKTKKRNSSISTSGNYNRFIGSTEHNHLINPKSKRAQNKFISITLISQLPNSDLDAYATAASVMSLKEAYEFLDSFALAYMVLQGDKKLVISKNITHYIEKESIKKF